MKLKQLKKLLNGLTKEQLERDLVYNSSSLSISGVVTNVRKQPVSLYNNFDDDPCTLKTMTELKEMYDGDKEEISACTIEIAKGDIVVEF